LILFFVRGTNAHDFAHDLIKATSENPCNKV